MLLPQEVVHGLYGIERFKRHFHEYCVPIAHRAIPKPRQFQCLQFAAVLAFATDEACRPVYIVGKMEGFSFIIFDGADQVDRIEVCAVFKHLHVFVFTRVNLATLQYLRTDGPVLVIGKERTSARFAYVLYDAAHTDRAIQFPPEINHEVGIFQLFDVRLPAT